MSRVLVIGAGISGLAAAQQLQQAGHEVVVLDKGRGVGGRMATRRVTSLSGEATFDHGAQFFTARREKFKIAVADWHRLGVVEQWFEGYPSPRDEKPHDVYPRYCGAGGMTGIAKFLTRGLDLQLNQEVESLQFEHGTWTAFSKTRQEYSGAQLLLTAPVPQALELFNTSYQALPENARVLETVRYEPCFAVLAILRSISSIPAPGALYVNEEPVSWLADNYLKGISAREGAITIHSTATFARAHYDGDLDQVGELLLDAARKYFRAEVESFQVRRWRYAKPENPLSVEAVHVPALNLAFAGDGLNGAKVEGAFLSGVEAARLLIKGVS